MPSGSTKFIPQLDGLRGIAIILVLISHISPPIPIFTIITTQGWMGVDLFFVLSGFLITGILLDTKRSPRYYLNFYARRGLRIWPIYYLLLFFLMVACPALHVFLPAHLVPAKYFLFYVQNIFVDQLRIPLVFSITWSLCIEEQFYLVWPWLVSWVKESFLPAVLAGVIAMIPIIRWLTFPSMAYKSNIIFRFDELAVGALIAWWMRSPRYDQEKFKRVCGAAAVVLLPVVVCMSIYDNTPALFMDSGYLYLPLAFGFAGLLGLTLTLSPTATLVKLLSLAPLRYTGKISYGLYLYHEVVHTFFWIYWPRARTANYAFGMLVMILQWCCVFAVASLSWYLLEKPLLRLKSHFETANRSPAPAAIAAC